MIQTLMELWLAWTLAFAAGIGAGWIVWGHTQPSGSVTDEEHQRVVSRHDQLRSELTDLKRAMRNPEADEPSDDDHKLFR